MRQPNWGVHKRTKLAILVLLPILYSDLCAIPFFIYDAYKCEIKYILVRVVNFKAADFIGPFPFLWHSQSKIGNIGFNVL